MEWRRVPIRHSNSNNSDKRSSKPQRGFINQPKVAA